MIIKVSTDEASSRDRKSCFSAKVQISQVDEDSGFASYSEGHKGSFKSGGFKTASADLSDCLGRKLNLKDGGRKSKSQRSIRVTQQPCETYFSQNSDGDTQLHIAVSMGYEEAACWLINKAWSPEFLDVRNDYWQTALHIAVLSGQAQIARRLIIAGANPSIRSYNGNTALHVACKNGDLGCAKALVEPVSSLEKQLFKSEKPASSHQRNLEIRNFEGEMCIHLAASTGRVDLMRLLVKAGASLHSQEAKGGRTALHVAVAQSHYDLVEFLLWECDPPLETTTYWRATAYQLALDTDERIAKLLLRFGAQELPPLDSEEAEESMEQDF